ncbi:MAG TPA: hypothetical protein VJ571_02705 [Candidatus Nitrosotalea sp.]|nr:hypothetical protein [Candidatus Nitrosotalea sp.]
MPESLTNAIRLTDETMQIVTESNLGFPFVILNRDTANEPRVHRINCNYARDRMRSDRMRPDSKKENKTGNHWLTLNSDLPSGTTRNCDCWK